MTSVGQKEGFRSAFLLGHLLGLLQSMDFLEQPLMLELEVLKGLGSFLKPGARFSYFLEPERAFLLGPWPSSKRGELVYRKRLMFWRNWERRTDSA